MRTTVPCPLCQQSLTFIATLRNLACPFCRSEIRFAGGIVPVGKRVRCGKCKGEFTAESPPPSLHVFASLLEPCPTCDRLLAIRRELPAGKKVRCYKCGTKFLPKRRNAASPELKGENATYHVKGEASQYGAEPTDVDPPPPGGRPAPRRPVSNTRLGKSTGRSSITHLATDPLAHIDPPDVASPPPADDEVDFFDQADRSVPSPPKVAANASANPTDLRAPRPAAPRQQTPKMLLNRRPQPPKELRKLPATAAEKATASTSSHMAAPTLAETPKQKSKRVPDEPAVTPPPKRTAEEPKPAAQRKRHRIEETPLQEPVPEVPTPELNAQPDIAESPALAEQPVVNVPLSSRSVMEKEAADALLDDPDVVVEEEADDEQPVALQEPPKPIPKPVEAPSPLRPSAPAKSITATSGMSGLNVPVKKVLTYAGTFLTVCLVGLGIYSLFNRMNRPKVYPTEGIVMFEGKPAVGATVTLFPVTKSGFRVFPTGKVGEDGTFKLTTFQVDDGAPAGRYKVTIARQMDIAEYKELEKNHTPEEIRRISEERAQDPLANKYANQRETGLTAEIPAPSNKLIFELD